MPETLTAEAFIEANTGGRLSETVDDLINRLNKLSMEGKLMGVNAWTACPFIAMGGNEEEYRKYYIKQHGFDPSVKWNDWKDVVTRLRELREKYFKN